MPYIEIGGDDRDIDKSLDDVEHEKQEQVQTVEALFALTALTKVSHEFFYLTEAKKQDDRRDSVQIGRYGIGEDVEPVDFV